MNNMPIGLYPVPGFEDRFAVDVHGNVFGISTNYARPLKTYKRGGTSAQNNGKNYHSVKYRDRKNGGKIKYLYVHDLVARTFHGPRPPGGKKGRRHWEVHHKNDNKDDNSAGNLEWRRRKRNRVPITTPTKPTNQEDEEVPF